MSRSYKRSPMWRSGEDSKRGKKRANKRVRNNYDLPNGKSYRKLYETWDIVDCKNLITDWNSSDSIMDLRKVKIKIKELSTRCKMGEHDLRRDLKYFIDSISK